MMGWGHCLVNIEAALVCVRLIVTYKLVLSDSAHLTNFRIITATKKNLLLLLLLRPGRGTRSIAISQSVCLSVCPRAYLWNRSTDVHEIRCADPPEILAMT